MLIYIHYLTMKKIITILFLVFAICGLQQTHQQAKPAPAATANANAKVTPAPATVTPATVAPTPKPAPVVPAPPKVQRQPHKEPGYPPTAGNPFGRDP